MGAILLSELSSLDDSDDLSDDELEDGMFRLGLFAGARFYRF